MKFISVRIIGLAAIATTVGVFATTPASQNVTVPTVDGQVVVVTWTGTSPAGAAGGDSTCINGVGTDGHIINLTVPPGTYANVDITAAFHINWNDALAQDLVLTIEKDGVNKGDSDGGIPQEDVSVGNPAAGAWDALVCSFAAAVPTAFNGKLTLTARDKPKDADRDGVFDSADLCPGTARYTAVYPAGHAKAGCDYVPPPYEARFFNFMSPPGVANSSGEPSLGCNWKTEKTFTNTNINGTTNSIPNGGTITFFGGFSPYMSKITFDDCASPANFAWDTKPLLLASTPRALGDPILFTDNIFGRTWVIQLEPGAGATIDYTDDDGTNFSPSTGPFTSANDFDHQTIASGPYAPPLTGQNPVFPHAVYYASQGVSEAVVFRSDDGGISFNAKIPMWTAAQCAGLHGHIKVAPDGTVYVPDKACTTTATPPIAAGAANRAAVVRSDDNGLTWKIKLIPHAAATSSFGADDPSVGIATDGTIYLGFQPASGPPHISVSKNKGDTWSVPVNVGAANVVVNGGPIYNIAFPAVVAGDPDRAAFSFFGTETPGADYGSAGFPGLWYLYVSTTYDGGLTWTTVNVTPGDPIQRGGICSGGTCRNLLDFFDMTIDKEGRLVIAGEDGCVTQACIDGDSGNDYASKGFITRQTGGKRMFAAYDPVEPERPGAPSLSGSLSEDLKVANLKWRKPDASGSPVTSYKVYHRVGTSGPYTLKATVPSLEYADLSYNSAVENYYHVTAVNAEGEGPFCLDFHPTFVVPENPCEPPGIKVVTDGVGDTNPATPYVPDYDIVYVGIAEPLGYEDSFVITEKLARFTTGIPPAGQFWVIIFPNLRYIALDSMQGPAAHVYGTAVPDPAGQGLFTFSREGLLDPRSKYLADGTIIHVVPRTILGSPAVGAKITGMDVRSRGGSASLPSRDTATQEKDYTVLGPIACAINTAPNPKLGADKASGDAPLTVTFDGLGSSDPDGDSIAEYSFKFGDGDSGYTGPSATVQYTYSNPGTFTATLEVYDSRGLKSLGPTTKQITVTEVNLRPRAFAGDPFSVPENSLASWTGQADDDNAGDTLTVSWQQIRAPGDPTVTLTRASEVNPEFIAPSVDRDTPLTFRLTVSDGKLQDTSDIVITVRNTSGLVSPPGAGNNRVGGAMPLLSLLVLSGLWGFGRRRRRVV